MRSEAASSVHCLPQQKGRGVWCHCLSPLEPPDLPSIEFDLVPRHCPHQIERCKRREGRRGERVGIWGGADQEERENGSRGLESGEVAAAWRPGRTAIVLVGRGWGICARSDARFWKLDRTPGCRAFVVAHHASHRLNEGRLLATGSPAGLTRCALAEYAARATTLLERVHASTNQSMTPVPTSPFAKKSA